MVDDQNQVPKLTGRESEQLAAQVAEIAGGDLPLAPGLRAAADETETGRLAQAMRWLAAEAEQGRSLDEAMAAAGGRLSQSVGKLVTAALRTGKFAGVLSKLVEHHRTVRQLRRSVHSALAYPLLLLALTFALFTSLQAFVVPTFRTMFGDFDLSLPSATLALFWWSEVGTWIIVAFIGVMLTASVLLRLMGGQALWQRTWATVPVVGPLSHWSGVSEWASMMHILLEHGVPLPEALRLAADGSFDANVAQVSRTLAKKTEEGQELSSLLAATHRLPAMLAPIVHSGQQTGTLSVAMRTASELYETRARLRAIVLRSIVPPLVFLLVGFLVGFILAGLFVPLVSLIQSLSVGVGGGPIGASVDLTPVHLIGLAVIGGALLWTVGLIYGRRRTASDDVMKRCLSMAGWTLILIGVVGAVAAAAGPVWIVLLPATPVVLIMAVQGFRQSERRALALVLAIAAERGIPLPQALHAFASECFDEMGLRTAALADLLEGGAALPSALRLSRSRFPLETAAALEFGCANDCLGPALRRAIQQSDRTDTQLRSLFEKFIYLGVVVLIGFGVVTFIMLNLIPTFDKMFQDFGLALPAPTILLIEMVRVTSQFGFVVIPLLIIMVFFMCVGLVYYTGYLPVDLPILGRLSVRTSSAVVMRLLGLAVERQQPLPQAIRSMAARFPQYHVRDRLWRAGRQIDDGLHWCDSLQQVGIATASQAAVLKSAERVGNLAWALDEMADSTLRCAGYRIATAVNVLFPAVLLFLGFCVLFIVVSLMLPLIHLIVQLA